MPQVPPLPEGVIQRVVPIMNGNFHARLTYESLTDKRKERKVIVTFAVEAGELVNVVNEEDEIVGQRFEPKDLPIFDKSAKESFIADDMTLVDPMTGVILKHADEPLTPELEAIPYTTQYNFFAFVASNVDIKVDEYIADTLDEMIAKRRLDIQK